VATNPAQVRSEGLTEQLADILFFCSSHNSGATITGNYTLFLPVNVTNRVDANNLTSQAVFSIDTGLGLTPSAVPGAVNGNSISFNGISILVPAGGSFNLRISNVRAAVNQLPSGTATVTGILSTPLAVNNSQVALGLVYRGLYATLADEGIPCYGSPVPATLSVTNFFAAQTTLASTRLTEGIPGAFTARGTTDDTGTRFLIKFSAFPAGAHIYLPDMVAGSDAFVPTSGGDLGLPQSEGEYVPGSGTLLLVRVQGAAADGSGGTPLATPTGGPTLLNSASEVPLTNGVGYAVYEVADSNILRVENAQFPTFVGITGGSAGVVGQESVSFGPVSTVNTASASDPMPRFAAVVPPSDCSVVGDCQASYFPHLSVSPTPIQLTAVAGLNSQFGYIPVINSGGGLLIWNASAKYQNGSGWLVFDPPSGIDTAGVRVYAKTTGLSAGTYQATVVIDAGPLAGTQSIPLTLTVQPVLPSTPVTIGAIVNAATFANSPLVSGSLATIFGAHLSGNQVSVTVEGQPATLLYAGATQINFQVPSGLPTQGFGHVIVTVDGVSSLPSTILFAPAFPETFASGVLNQDYSVNSTSKPAAGGSLLQIFVTGLPSGATVTAQIGNRLGLTPTYAGPAPSLVGVQQVNVQVPASLPSGTTQLILCAAANGLPYCSDPFPLVIQ